MDFSVCLALIYRSLPSWILLSTWCHGIKKIEEKVKGIGIVYYLHIDVWFYVIYFIYLFICNYFNCKKRLFNLLLNLEKQIRYFTFRKTSLNYLFATTFGCIIIFEVDWTNFYPNTFLKFIQSLIKMLSSFQHSFVFFAVHLQLDRRSYSMISMHPFLGKKMWEMMIINVCMCGRSIATWDY